MGHDVLQVGRPRGAWLRATRPECEGRLIDHHVCPINPASAGIMEYEREAEDFGPELRRGLIFTRRRGFGVPIAVELSEVIDEHDRIRVAAQLAVARHRAKARVNAAG